MIPLAIEPSVLPADEEQESYDMGDPIHSAVQVNLAVEFGKHRDFRVYSELDLRLAGHDCRPDLCLYPREPLDLRSEAARREDPPQLAVEILSAKQGLPELLRRADTLFAAGVKSFWLVMPPIRSITVILPDGREEHHHAGIVTDPATGVTADLDAVFS